MTDTIEIPTPIRRIGLALGALVVWTLVLILAWAIQPLSHTQVVGFVELDDGGFERVLETTECNSLFSSEARDESVALPDFEFGFAFPQPPCEKPHSDARITFVMNAVVIVILLAAWIRWFLHSRRPIRP
jgi:hypothetical protein